jgi:hypothetical protein
MRLQTTSKHSERELSSTQIISSLDAPYESGGARVAGGVSSADHAETFSRMLKGDKVSKEGGSSRTALVPCSASDPDDGLPHVLFSFPGLSSAHGPWQEGFGVGGGEEGGGRGGDPRASRLAGHLPFGQGCELPGPLAQQVR